MIVAVAARQVALPSLLALVFVSIYILGRLFGGVVEFVTFCWLITSDSSWESTPLGNFNKMNRFSRRFASIPSHDDVKDLSWVYQSIGGLRRHHLMPSPCSSYHSLSLGIDIDISTWASDRSGVVSHPSTVTTNNTKVSNSTTSTIHKTALASYSDGSTY